MPKIKALYVVSITDEYGYTFGYVVGPGVTEIKDVSAEFPDSIHSAYQVFDENNNLNATIENAPVVIEYFKQK